MQKQKTNPTEAQEMLGRSQRPFAKQTEKLGGIPYYTENIGMKMSNPLCFTDKPEQPVANKHQ